VKGLSEQSQYPGTYFQHPIITEDIGYGCDEPPANQCTMG
jgi:hypothetical protein